MGLRRKTDDQSEDAGRPLPEFASRTEFISRDDVPQTTAGRVREAVTKAKAASEDARGRLEGSRSERPLIAIGMETIERDNSAGGGLLAGALAFRLFLVALPLTLVLISSLGFLLDLDADGPEDTAKAIGVGAATARSVATSAALARDGRWITFFVGFFALVLALRTLIKSMRLVHVLAWRLPLTKMPKQAQALLAGLGLIVAFLVVSACATWLRNRTPGGGVTLSIVLALLWSVAWSGVELLLPRAHDAPWFTVIPGGVLLGVGTQVLHAVTVFYFAGKVSSMSDTYGPMGAALVALLWFYFASRVFVYAAMLNATIWDRYRRGDAVLPGSWGEWVTEKAESILGVTPADLTGGARSPASDPDPEPASNPEPASADANDG